MGHRIAYEPTVPELRQRRPRVEKSAHLRSIRLLPCISCFTRPAQAAHLRVGSRKYGKRETGIAEKPSDRWTLPLCEACHLTGPLAQHKVGETEFYRRIHIDPFATALALWAAEGDLQLMEQIVAETRRT